MADIKWPPLRGIDAQFGAVKCVCCEQFQLEEATRLPRYENVEYRCSLCRHSHNEETCKSVASHLRGE